MPCRRRAALAAFAVIGILVVPATASAAVTQSNVTVPADPSFIHFDGANPQITVVGTSNGTAGDNVDLYCTNGTGASFTASLIKATVPVAAGGGFSFDGKPVSTQDRACVIRAVPAGAAPTAATDLTTFTGPRGFLGEEESFRDNAGIYDYYIYNSQTQGGMDFDSLGSCGLDDSFVYDPASLAKSNALFYCNAYLPQSNGTSALRTRSLIQVDGRNAYPPGSAAYLFTGVRNVPGFAPIRFSTSFSSTTGDMTIDETNPILRCAGNAYPPTATNCTQFERAPVDVHRLITMDHLGRMVRFVDAYTSRDGAAHTVDLGYEQDFRTSPPADPAYRFPWRESTFNQHTLLDTFPGPGGSSTGSIFVKAQKNSPDGDPTYPQGAITYSAPPDRVSFLNYPTNPNSSWALDYRRTVPASGRLTLAFAYSQAFLAADVAALARDAEAALAPATAGGGTPLPGGGGSGAGGGGGGGGGGQGGSGGRGTSSFRGVSVRTHRLGVSKGRLLLRLACPSRAVRGCRGTATLYAKTAAKKGKRPKRAVVYGRAKFSIALRRTKSVRLKLSRAGRSAFRQNGGKLTAVLTIQARDRASRPHRATTSTTVRLVTKKTRTKR
jgi:hypothetical protein